ncbi:hypothetical protein TKK_0000724 [Trichogramma kaykai]
MESRTFNYATEVKEEFNDMHYYKNDSGETEEQSTDTKNVQLLRCLQENINNTLEENKGIDEFQSNQGIKIEFECKDEKPDVNSLVSDEVREGIHECQPNQEIKIEFECKDVKPDVNLLVPVKVNDCSYGFDEYDDIKIGENFATHSSIKVETESMIKKEFYSDTIKTIDLDTGSKLNGQKMKMCPLVKRKKQSMQCKLCLKKLSSKPSLDRHIDTPNMKAQLLNRKIKKNFIGKELPSKIMPFLIFISLNC